MKPVVSFVDRDAVLRTSAGMRPSAWLTRFCTSTAARSGSRSMSNVTVIVADAAVGARRGHVAHALDAVDRLLERRGHRALHRLRVGAGVERRHRDRRRRQLGIPRDRQRRNRDRAREDDQQRADGRQDRPADEDVGEHEQCSPTCRRCPGCRRCGAGRRRRHHRRAVANLLQRPTRSAARRPSGRSARRSRCR